MDVPPIRSTGMPASLTARIIPTWEQPLESTKAAVRWVSVGVAFRSLSSDQTLLAPVDPSPHKRFDARSNQHSVEGVSVHDKQGQQQSPCFFLFLIMASVVIKTVLFEVV